MAEQTSAQVTPAEDGMKLMRFLERRLQDVPPKALLQKWIRTGQVRINKKRTKPFALLFAGDVVRVPPFALLRPVAEDMEIAEDMGIPALPNAIAEAVPGATPGTDASLMPFAAPDASTPDAEPNAIAGVRPGAGPNAEPGATPATKTDAVQENTAMQPPSLQIPFAGKASDALPFSIITATSDLLVINKPAGLPVQPGSGVHESLSSLLASAYAQQSFIPAPAHRIDRHTSGIVLAGRTHAMQQQLHAWFAKEGGIGKEYLAWVALYEDGASRLADAGLITAPENFCCQGNARHAPYLVADASVPKTSDTAVNDSTGMQNRQETTPERTQDIMPVVLMEDLLAKQTMPGGQEKMQVVQQGGLMAKSRVQLIYCIPYKTCSTRSYVQGGNKSQKALWHHAHAPRQTQAMPKAAALIHIQLLTGRTHQIRVQLASRGLPIIGDGRYGGPVHMPMLLHAWRVTLPDNRHFSALPDWPSPFTVTLP